MNNSNGGAFSPAVLWNLIALSIPIVAAVVVATYKILRVLRDEIRSEISPIMSRFDEMEKRFVDTVRALWEHNGSQDVRIEAVTASHNRLRGAHDAIISMGGHGEVEQRKIPRVPGPHCPDQG